MDAVPRDDRRGRVSSRPASSRSSAGWSRSTAAGRFDHRRHASLAPAQMGQDAGAARRAAGDRARPADAAQRPPAVPRRALRRWPCPTTPDYAAALQAIGPAAIKLGQALVDPARPGRRGRRRQSASASGFAAARALPGDQGGDRAGARSAARDAVQPSSTRSRSAPRRSPRSIMRSRPKGREVAVKVLRPGIEEEFARAIETYEWAAAHVELLGGEAERLRPRMVIAHFKQWTRRELDLQREAASASELTRQYGRRARLPCSRDRLAPHRAAGADAGMARRDQAQQARRADRRRP